MSRKLLVDSRSVGDGSIVTGDFNTIEIIDADHEKVAKEQMRIAKVIGAVLVKAYNNRQWKVVVDMKGQMLIIGCDSVSNDKGYHIHMAGRTLHDLQERALKAAGEILERHAVSRSKKFNPDTFETLLRDRFDNVLTSDSAAEPI